MSNPGKELQEKREKEYKTCPCGNVRLAYIEAMDLCPKCQGRARATVLREKKKREKLTLLTNQEEQA